MSATVTLTLNPTIDISYEVEAIEPTRKLRASAERHDPGGGGINVARVLARVGGDVQCLYLAGGPVGAALDQLLEREGLPRTRVAISGDTRASSTVFERSTGLEYRVVASGPEIAEPEWQECLRLLAKAEAPFVVASGSLPEGVPDDFYARLAVRLAPQGAKLVLDSSGRGLAGGLGGAGVYLVKPNVAELEFIAGRELATEDAIAAAAMEIVRRGGAEHVAVTMADDGALLASEQGVLRQPGIRVSTVSAVGAGDSFVAAMVHALGEGWAMGAAFRFGVAAGAAAAMTPGTDLARAEDIRRLYDTVRVA